MPDLTQIETQLLLEGIFRCYGFDLRDYAASSIRRRVLASVAAESLPTISALQERILHDEAAFSRFIVGLTVHVTSMFRDPGFYASFRERVVPLLRTYPFSRIWVAGCSTGEEVYSLAIVLYEEGLLDRVRIYATDLSDVVLDRARVGIFPLDAMRDYTTNYQQAGGKATFSAYYTATDDGVVLRPFLRENVVFAQHNLACDTSFNEFNVILCRNVMIYFNRTLQARVHGLLHQSLVRLGILALGRRESMRFTPVEARYEDIDTNERIYRRVT